MLIDIQNDCYKLLRLLGCDFKIVEHGNIPWQQFGVLIMEFLFACFMIYLLWKMLYNAMIRFFNPRKW